ncbi:MAG: hypothetical protein AB1611_09840 [bacterium]
MRKLCRLRAGDGGHDWGRLQEASGLWHSQGPLFISPKYTGLLFHRRAAVPVSRGTWPAGFRTVNLL